MKDLHTRLARLQQEHLYRSRPVIHGPMDAELHIDGRRYLAFCSNDYLGLANHPEVIDALRQGASSCGVGSGAAHLVCGHNSAHQHLEEELAAFTQRPRALLFSTGYMANLGVISALLGHKDSVYQDRLNHASLLDAGKLAGARLVRYRHADTESLTRALESTPKGDKLIASDGVFSMDGDIAPLPALAELAARHDATLMIDDAHGLGVIGPNGGGSLEHFNLNSTAVPVLVGTLGKAFGCFGAFVAGSEELIEFLIQRARSFIYTTAMPAALAEATRASLRLVQNEPWRRERLHALCERLRRGASELDLPLQNSCTPIFPLLLQDAHRALTWSAELRKQGIWVSAIRPPTVAPGTARLRITLSCQHTEAHIDRLLDALSAIHKTEQAEIGLGRCRA